MEIKYLETVLAVADNLSYSKAAIQINSSQPSVSRQVAIVENELGSPIFNHVKGGKVELTDFGRSSIPIIRELISGYNYLQQSSENGKLGTYINFRLGVYKGPFAFAPKEKLILGMAEKHPEIALSIIECRKDDAVKAILENKMDAALLYQSFYMDDTDSTVRMSTEGISVKELFIKTPSIAMPKDHPFAKNSTISFADLKYQDIIMNVDITRLARNDLSVQHEGFLRSCQQYGYIPKIRVITNSQDTDIRNSALMTNGWMYPTFVPKSMNNDGIALLQVKDPIYFAKYYLLTPSKRHPGTNVTEKFLIDILTKDDSSCIVLKQK